MQSGLLDTFFWAMLSTALLALLVGITLGYLRNAREICEEERARTRAEHDAFAAFADRLADIEPVPAAPPAAAKPAGRSVPEVQDGPPDARLESVRQAYRETVMAISHYEEDYDEPLAQNMAAEFGEGLAAAVTEGDRYTPQLQQALLDGAETARHRRAEFLSVLDRELGAISETEDRLGSLQAELDEVLAEQGDSFPELRSTWRRLEDLEDRCETVIQDRQAQVHRRRPNGLDGRAFYEYVYQSLPVRYPVLAETTGLVDRVRTARRRVLKELTRRA